MSACDLFVIVIPLFITWGATSACASVPRKYVLWPSPIVATLLTGGAVAIAYFIVVVTHLPGHLHSYEQFEKTTSAPVLLGIFLFIAVSNFAYYGQLTTMRLRDNTKPD